MARRIGKLEEFEFKAVGGNYNQGVSPFTILLVLRHISSRLLIRMMIQPRTFLSMVSLIALYKYMLTNINKPLLFFLFFFQRLAVGISVSGLVFEEEDFIKPWEGHNDNLERYERNYYHVIWKIEPTSFTKVETYNSRIFFT
jgi:hypothetical protein